MQSLTDGHCCKRRNGQTGRQCELSEVYEQRWQINSPNKNSGWGLCGGKGITMATALEEASKLEGWVQVMHISNKSAAFRYNRFFIYFEMM